MESTPVRNLVVILGDQLDPQSTCLKSLDPRQDRIWMAEVSGESTAVWSHKVRIAVFLSAMRHFRDDLREKGFQVHYACLDDPENTGTLASELERSIRNLRPQQILVVEPGEWRIRKDIQDTAKKFAVPCQFLPDHHFLCSEEEFDAHAASRKQLRMEFFYRHMRKKTGILMEDIQPLGGKWNFDAENRQPFGKQGPANIPPPVSFLPDTLTREVVKLVEKYFPGHPGSLEHFDWPVTSGEAETALKDFIRNRLSGFGRHQDAMWTSQPFLYHSRLSSSLNMKLLNPRQVITTAEKSYKKGLADLASTEGFIRQILGWREYVRRVYWKYMPDYLGMNYWNSQLPLPKFYWTAETEMNCLREVLRQTLEYGYAHHIQRLMVTGLFALLLGVNPVEVHRWYLAIYLDAIEWVELPNTLGMSQYADGGIMASKPYIASGKYIQRMSNYCRTCVYQPDQSTGDKACPFTTLYWDFLSNHQKLLGKNPRMSIQLNNLRTLHSAQRKAIHRKANQVRIACAP